MKQLLALCFAAILLFGLCACGGESGVQNQTDAVAQTREPTETVSDEGEKIPSEEMIEKDVSDKLTAKNPYASLTGIETVKSLTEEGHYEITLSATAETKYADWVYEAELEYTKYDQGWMLDDLDWLQEEYTVSREPTAEEIAEILNREFSNTDSLYGGWEYAFPVDSGDVKQTPFRGTQFTWTGRAEMMHAEYEVEIESYWHYEAESDSWALNELETLEGLNDKYEAYLSEGRVWLTADFTGTWQAANMPQTLTISNFTRDGFDAEVNGEKEHYELRSARGYMMRYNGSSHSLTFVFSEKRTTIIRGDLNNTTTDLTVIIEE